MAWGIPLKSVKAFLQMISIRTKLTLSYALGVFILLALVTLLIYLVTLNILYKANYQFLADEVDSIRYLMKKSPLDEKELRQTVMVTPQHPDGSIYRYYTRVLDENKNVIMQTEGMDKVISINKYFTKITKSPDKKRYFWYNKNGNEYLMVQSLIKIGKEAKLGYVQIALDLSQQHIIINDRKKLIAIILAAAFAAIFMGFIITQRGMRSLFLLTENVKKITATSLDKRIDPKLWPKELSHLGIAFNQMFDRIEHSVLRLKQFSADLAHELRTPITNLIGQTEVTLSRPRSEEEYQQVLESNLEEFQRLTALIENILFLARADNPMLMLAKQNVQVEKEIELVIEFYQALADEKNMQVSLSGRGMIHANPDIFRRLINNLLSNALKYTEANGRIEFIISEVANQYVEIICADTGVGIAAEHIPHIFDRFYRVDPSRTHPGVGLGLAIVKSIVELNRGTIWLESEVGKGTKVFIHLPKVM